MVVSRIETVWGEEFFSLKIIVHLKIFRPQSTCMTHTHPFTGYKKERSPSPDLYLHSTVPGFKVKVTHV